MSVEVSSKMALWRGLVVGVVLLALFGWSAVFASSARADAHSAVITVECDRLEVALSNYDNSAENPPPNSIGVTVDEDGVITEEDIVLLELFVDSFSTTMALDPAVEQTLIVNVGDFEDPDGSEGWTFREERVSPACPTTSTAPTSTAPTSTAAAPSTLPLTGAEPVSWALLAVALFGSGGLALLSARRAED